MSLPSSMADFVPRDRWLQKAYSFNSKKKTPKDYLHNCIQPSFFIFSTTLSEIEDETSKLKSGKSTGPVSLYQSRYPQTFEDCSPIKTT